MAGKSRPWGIPEDSASVYAKPMDMSAFNSLPYYAEPAMTVGSALMSMPLAGYAGMIDPEWGKDVSQSMTYIPRTEAGMEGLDSLSNHALMNAATKLDEGLVDLGSTLGGGNPYLSTAAYMLPNVVGSIYSPTVRSAATGATKYVDEAVINARRPFNDIHTFTEVATGSHPKSVALADAGDQMAEYMAAKARAKTGIASLGDAYNVKPTVRQGSWLEGTERQNNPVFVDKLDNMEPMEWDQLRNDLKQAGIGYGRQANTLFNRMGPANSMRVQDIDPEFIKSISAYYDERGIPAVVQHHPDNSAQIFSYMDDKRGGLGQFLGAPQLKGKKIRYGVADEGIDRGFIGPSYNEDGTLKESGLSAAKKAGKRKPK